MRHLFRYRELFIYLKLFNLHQDSKVREVCAPANCVSFIRLSIIFDTSFRRPRNSPEMTTAPHHKNNTSIKSLILEQTHSKHKQMQRDRRDLFKSSWCTSHRFKVQGHYATLCYRVFRILPVREIHKCANCWSVFRLQEKT